MLLEEFASVAENWHVACALCCVQWPCMTPVHCAMIPLFSYRTWQYAELLFFIALESVLPELLQLY